MIARDTSVLSRTPEFGNATSVTSWATVAPNATMPKQEANSFDSPPPLLMLLRLKRRPCDLNFISDSFALRHESRDLLTVWRRTHKCIPLCKPWGICTRRVQSYGWGELSKPVGPFLTTAIVLKTTRCIEVWQAACNLACS
jgi:hypothetical protein